mgnify:CR=1 FL=1|jgi:hypothetical protein
MYSAEVLCVGLQAGSHPHQQAAGGETVFSGKGETAAELAISGEPAFSSGQASKVS